MTHQQLRRGLSDFTNPSDILRCRRRGLDLLTPLRPEIEGEVFLKGCDAIELLKGNRGQHGVILESMHLLFHGFIDKEEICHQLAIAQLVHHTLQEAAHEAGVLGHGV